MTNNQTFASLLLLKGSGAFFNNKNKATMKKQKYESQLRLYEVLMKKT
jgi:hypothetical protein